MAQLFLAISLCTCLREVVIKSKWRMTVHFLTCSKTEQKYMKVVSSWHSKVVMSNQICLILFE